MHYELKQRFDQNPLIVQDQMQLDEIQAENAKLFSPENGQVKKSNQDIIEKKNEMIGYLEKEVEDLKKKIQTSAAQINAGILIEKDTVTADALKSLNEIKVKHIDQY